MASLTIKGIPDDLLDQLRRSAELHRRSLNSEVLHLSRWSHRTSAYSARFRGLPSPCTHSSPIRRAPDKPLHAGISLADLSRAQLTFRRDSQSNNMASGVRWRGEISWGRPTWRHDPKCRKDE